jgi:hypothetical protein
MYRKELVTFWVTLGRIGSILGQKLALLKLLENTTVLYAYSVLTRIERPKRPYDTSLPSSIF